MLLVRATELDLRLSGNGSVRGALGASETSVPSSGLSLLAFFEKPGTVAAALEACAPRQGAPEALLELADTIILLHRAGALRAPGQNAPGAHGFSSAGVHISMLLDRGRTDAFCRAVRAAVRPSDVVLEIGTGTGILAATAARAGARRVFALETSPIAEVAQRVVETNGVSDRVSVIRGRSSDVTLPEVGDLLVAELIGGEPLHEEILEVVLDARRRLLKGDARFIPARVEVLGIAVSISRACRAQHVSVRRPSTS